jgi:hypothetical protein
MAPKEALPDVRSADDLRAWPDTPTLGESLKLNEAEYLFRNLKGTKLVTARFRYGQPFRRTKMRRLSFALAAFVTLAVSAPAFAHWHHHHHHHHWHHYHHM